jgi:hypothetical protein
LGIDESTKEKTMLALLPVTVSLAGDMILKAEMFKTLKLDYDN